MTDGLRCPYCNAKLAEALVEGVLFIRCRRCTKGAGREIIVRFDTRVKTGVT